MNVVRTRWRGRPSAAVAGAVALVLLAAPRSARAANDQQPPGKPWLPMVEEGASPEEVYATYSLSVVHVGENEWRVNRGPYRESVSRSDFFVTVGRPDLAEREQRGNSKQNAFVFTGFALLATGGVVLYAGASRGGWDPPPVYGFGMMAAGVGVLWIGLRMHGPLVTPEEVDGVVGRYNELLKVHIEEETGTSKPRPVQARLELIAPFVDGRSGGGLMAVASF